MTWRWLTCFSLLAPALWAADVSGRVELIDSKQADVRSRRDFSGVVISLKPLSGLAAPPAPQRATMLQKNKTFSPHVLAITTNSAVSFPNADPIFHNAFSNYNGQIFDVGLYPPGTTRTVRFGQEGVVRVFCNIHSAMSAIIVVVSTPYFATTAKNGSFSIPNIPPGDYTMSVFHERATEMVLRGLERRITVDSGTYTLPPLRISEAGFISIPHTNKFGHDYSPEPRDPAEYPGGH